MKEPRSGRDQGILGNTGKSTEPIFDPLGYFMVRAPLFPIEIFRALHTLTTDSSNEHLINSPRVLQAIAVGSLSLLDEIERQTNSQRDKIRREKKLLRYLIRMSTRPTPYGLFAGVALGHWGNITDLAIAEPAAHVQARLDMGWLMSLIWKLEALPEVRRHLCFVANSAVYFRNGRAILQERAEKGPATETQGVSVRVTEAVKRALELARQPIAYRELAERLLSSIAGATPEKVENLLTELWKQTLLLSDLRPPLTGELHPASYLQQRLATIPPVATLAGQLAAIDDSIRAWEAAPLETKIPQYRSLIQVIKQCTQTFESSSFGAVADAPNLADTSESLAVPESGELKKVEESRQKEFLQVDMGMALDSAMLASSIGEDAARMAETLLRLTPLPHGMTPLATYRRAFLERYGPDREVLLVELLDQNFGLGALETPNGVGVVENAEHQHSRRHQALLDLALSSLRRRQQVVNLDEEMLKRLETWSPDPATMPFSVDLNVMIAAASAADINAGHYQLILGPNTGGQEAGRNFSRFASLFGSEGIDNLRDTAARMEELAHGALPAELVYLPRENRMGNVIIRPVVYHYELAYATLTTLPADQVIPLNELVVGLRGERFYVHWTRKDIDVVVRASHMLNPMSGPPLIRLLTAISLDNTPLLTSFDWGDAAHFPFLPRVQVDRLVLSLAQWRLTPDVFTKELARITPEAFQSTLSAWREDWHVPRYVYLSIGDNRLLLDLEQGQQSNELRSELLKLPEGEALLLQEVFPTLDQAWVQGPGGHYMTEFIFPLIRRAAVPNSAGKAASSRSAASEKLAPLPGVLLTCPPEQRLKGVGSEWLFLKLYCGKDLQDDLIGGPLRYFARDALKEGFAEDWFFLRYSDPDPHIRLRFRGEAKVLTGKLLPVLCEWATWLMTKGSCLRYVFDTYDREIERYGGLAGMEVAEALFGADSQAVADFIALLQRHTLELERKLLAVLSTDDLLAALGASAPVRLGWYRQRVTERHQTGQAYRQKSSQLRALLSGSAQAVAALPGGAEVAAILAARREALALVAARLAALENEQGLARPLTTLYGSYVHMHCNRLLGTDRQAEEEVVGLLLRTQESLERAPVG